MYFFLTVRFLFVDEKERSHSESRQTFEEVVKERDQVIIKSNEVVPGLHHSQ